MGAILLGRWITGARAERTAVSPAAEEPQAFRRPSQEVTARATDELVSIRREQPGRDCGQGSPSADSSATQHRTGRAQNRKLCALSVASRSWPTTIQINGGYRVVALMLTCHCW